MTEVLSVANLEVPYQGMILQKTANPESRCLHHRLVWILMPEVPCSWSFMSEQTLYYKSNSLYFLALNLCLLEQSHSLRWTFFGDDRRQIQGLPDATMDEITASM